MNLRNTHLRTQENQIRVARAIAEWSRGRVFDDMDISEQERLVADAGVAVGECARIIIDEIMADLNLTTPAMASAKRTG